MGYGPASARGLRYTVFWLVAVIVVIVDQATKAAVRMLVSAGSVSTLIPGILNLTRVQNTGAAFGVGKGGSVFFVVFAVVAIIVCCIIVWRGEFPVLLAIPFGFVAGGGVGNMIDRLSAGSVTDFLSFGFVSFPVFNVADVCVTAGVIVGFIGWAVWDARRERREGGDTEAA